MGTTALSKVGARRLAAAEAKIERGLATFIEVGEALVSIRDERLYRADHDTFEAYCKSRWGFTDRRARQLIDAAQIGTVVPVSNEAQARPLTSLDGPDEVREVYAAAEAEGDTTAAGLTRAVKRRKATTTSTTETVTFDKEDGFVAQPAEGGADEDSSASKGRTETPASPSVPPEVFVTCPTCGGSGEIEAKETAA